MARLLEWGARWLAWRLPRSLVYWCAMRVLSEVTTRPELSHVTRLFHVSEIRFMYALEAWANARPRA